MVAKEVLTNDFQIQADSKRIMRETGRVREILVVEAYSRLILRMVHVDSEFRWRDEAPAPCRHFA
jgi:hypothetical protein